MRNWFVGIQKCGYYGLGTLGMVCRKDSVTLNVGHPGNPTLDSAVRKSLFKYLFFFKIKNIDQECVYSYLFYFFTFRFWPMRWVIILDKVIVNERRKMAIGIGRRVS